MKNNKQLHLPFDQTPDVQNQPFTRRTVIGWREIKRQNEAARHSAQFSQARMPGTKAAKLHKRKTQ